MTLTFAKQVAGETEDSMGNAIITTENVVINNCLVAPITEPATAREQQAMEQSRIQVRVHLPKATTEDVSDSAFTYDGKLFRVDSDSVVFMEDNTPTQWNRYFRAECVDG